MNIGGLLVALLVGAIAGFLAGKVMTGRGFGLIGNTIVGVVGAAIFGALFGSLNLFNTGFVNEVVGGTIGAVILLFLISLIRRA